MTILDPCSCNFLTMVKPNVFGQVLFGVFIVTFQFLIQDSAGSYSGTLLLLQAGCPYRLGQVWDGIPVDYGSRDDPYYHQWGIGEMVQAVPLDFRSQLIDRWDELGVHTLEIYVLNADGMQMSMFRFDGIPSGTSFESAMNSGFIVDSTAEVEYRSYQDPSIYIHNRNALSRFSFMSLNFGSIAALQGEQVMISSEVGAFKSLPGPSSIGCYDMFINATDGFPTVNVTSVLECGHYCLGVQGCGKIALFFMASQNVVKCIAMPSTMVFTSYVVSGDCNYDCQAGNARCGGTYTMGDNYTVDVFSTLAMASAITSSMSVNSVQETILTNTIFYALTQNYVSIPHQYVTGIKIVSYSYSTYELAISPNNCNWMQNNQSDDQQLVYGHNVGGAWTFSTNVSYELQPTLAECVRVVFEMTNEVIDLSLNYSTNNFLFAGYVGIYAEWYNSVNLSGPCNVQELMSDQTLIPDGSIQVQQKEYSQRQFDPFEYIYVPTVSVGVLHINLRPPNHTQEFWVEYVRITATADVFVDIYVKTHGDCTNQITKVPEYLKIDANYTLASVTFTTPHVEYFTDLKKSGDTQLCVMELELYVLSQLNTDVVNFGYNVRAYGCRINPGESYAMTCQGNENLLENTDAILVYDWWFTRMPDAATALRPHGIGLAFADVDKDPMLQITLSQDASQIVQVKSVILIGNVVTAHIEYASSHRMVTSNGTMAYEEFDGVSGNILRITDMFSSAGVTSGGNINVLNTNTSTTSGANYEVIFTNFTLKIFACISDNTSDSTTPAGMSTPNSVSPSDNITHSTPSNPVSPSDNTTHSTPSNPVSPSDNTTHSTPSNPVSPSDNTTHSTPSNPVSPSDNTTESTTDVQTATTSTTDVQTTTTSTTSSPQSTTESQTTTTDVHTTTTSTTSSPQSTTEAQTTTTDPHTTTTSTTSSPQSTTESQTTTTDVQTTTTSTTSSPQSTTETQTTTTTDAHTTTTSTTSSPQSTTEAQTTTTGAHTTTTSTTSSPQSTTEAQTTTTSQTTTTTEGQTTTTSTTSSPQTTTATQTTTTGPQITTTSTTSQPITLPQTTSSTLPANPVTTTTSRSTTSTKPPKPPASPPTTSSSPCTPTARPPACCYCTNITRNITVEEVEEMAEEIVKNLTVAPTETAAFKRTKISAPDRRTSAKVVGTVGVAVMVTVGTMVVAMDIDHILRLLNFLKNLWKSRKGTV